MTQYEGESADAGPDVLTNQSETLFRQIHPTHRKRGGGFSAEAFTPSRRDEGMLSTLREAVGAEEAHRRWTEVLGRESVGTFGVTVGEIDAVEVARDPNDASAGTVQPLQALADADFIGVEDHASVDFTSLPTPGRMKQAGRKLLEAASDRGVLHEPPPSLSLVAEAATS